VDEGNYYLWLGFVAGSLWAVADVTQATGIAIINFIKHFI